MRRWLPLASIALASIVVSTCGGGTSGPTGGAQATAGGSSPAPAPGASTSTNATPVTGPATPGTVAIPDSCKTGFIAYLKAIEPVVSDFKASTSTFGDFFDVDQAAGEKGIELMTTNGGRATYSCSEVGLEFAYFDSHSPWAAIQEVAAANAPGTVDYLQTHEKVSSLDNAQLSDYSVTTCDDAVSRIKAGVSDTMGAGQETVDDMAVPTGVALLGLYHAYLGQVQAGACPADKLGNDEFAFFGTH
jgi:hypothetical protein